MLESPAFPRAASGSVRAHPAPRSNSLLGALPPADYARLLPDLDPVVLRSGLAIHRAGEVETHAYFITAGIVSRVYVTESGSSAEFAVTGREGVIGIATFLGGASTTSSAVVLTPGHAYRLGAGVVAIEKRRGGPLAQMLFRYTQAMIAQTGQIAVCYRHHSLEQQLCRWILACLDRLPSNELAMTHELIAHMLGVRREGVSQAAKGLQRQGLIRCGRGHIAVLDRRGLEARVCECYAAIKREYARLIDLRPTAG